LKQLSQISLAARLTLLFLCVAPAWAQVPRELLTNAIDALSLPAEKALTGVDIAIEGVVTVTEPDWGGRFFVQDATAGIFVENIGDRQPAAGDVVRVTGVSHPGGFAPIITRPRWDIIGKAPLPPAKTVPIEQLMSGVEDSQRVEISGTVRATQRGGATVAVQILSGGYRLQAFVPPAAFRDPQSLVGAKVRVRGTAAAAFKAQVRQLITMNLYVPVPEDFIVEKMEEGDPFDEPAVSIESLAQYRPEHAPNKRVHVRGTVTYQRPGEDLFLQDATGGLQVKTLQPLTVEFGKVVEAVGFADFDHFHAVLQDAVFRQTEASSKPAVTESVTLQELRDGFHHADLITLQGKVVDRMVRHAEPAAGEAFLERVTLTVQATNFLFTVEGPATQSNAGMAELPIGCTIKVTGICLSRLDSTGVLESLQLLLPSVNNLRLLQKPSWLTAGRLLIGLTLLSALLILAVSWMATLSRKNVALKILIRDKVKAQADLQQAHDLLEERVRERTAQLKVEMTARREAEVHFKATLAERTRLAQELHDTLEQCLTGIGLQLDTAAKLFGKQPEGASHHLEVARDLMTQSQIELRRSIWDLRSRELEQFDLPKALQASARESFACTNIEVELETTGTIRHLSEVVEENLLRIGREAFTNVIRHAGASRVKIGLEFGAQAVTMRITDNGRGFSPANCPGASGGHFGLLGMSERTKRLEGQLRVVSAPGEGTRLEVEVPLRLANNATAATAAAGPELI
jgi:signal transduction histidine kinase